MKRMSSYQKAYLSPGPAGGASSATRDTDSPGSGLFTGRRAGAS